jgi:hypothetical protein
MRSSIPTHKKRLTGGNESSIVAPVYTRCAIDVASLKLRHVRVDENDAYLDTLYTGLNNCLSVEANKDQTSRNFIQDVVMSMFDEGVVAIVPVDTTEDIRTPGTFDILSMRTGRIMEWFPDHVRVEVYNDVSGRKEIIMMHKARVAIVENPLYSVMNENNSTVKRLIEKLNLLDSIDQQSGSGKLDLIIQLPYVIKTEARRAQAEQRREDIVNQLTNSRYGIAYTDATEKVVQLNRPAENNLLAQVEYLTRMLYSQLGMTEAIFDGTADEKAVLNYYTRTVEPVISAISLEMKRKFISKTAITQGQSIMHFRNPFGTVTPTVLAELSDKLSRNEVVSSNEIRAAIGLRPSKQPNADELRNKNIAQPQPDVTNDANLEKGDTTNAQ